MGTQWWIISVGVASLLLLAAGTCPIPPESTTTFCAKPFTDACNNTGDCMDGFTCCDHPCGKYCALIHKITTVAKPGICPAPLDKSIPSTIFCTTPITDECTIDGNCAGDLKCCETPCGKYCAPPSKYLAASKPGICPAPLDPTKVFCARNSRHMCSHDGECPQLFKCCGNPCGKYCADPVERLEQGECPLAPDASSIFCSTPITNSCNSDKDCSVGFKCCDNPCGKYCAFNLKRELSNILGKGSCPIPPDPRTTLCALPIVDSCFTDHDCDLDIKCCEHPCGKYCSGTLDIGDIEKPGLCPRIFQYGRCFNRDNECTSDSHCRGKSKCCNTKCGTSCVPAKNGWYFDLRRLFRV